MSAMDCVGQDSSLMSPLSGGVRERSASSSPRASVVVHHGVPCWPWRFDYHRRVLDAALWEVNFFKKPPQPYGLLGSLCRCHTPARCPSGMPALPSSLTEDPVKKMYPKTVDSPVIHIAPPGGIRVAYDVSPWSYWRQWRSPLDWRGT